MHIYAVRFVPQGVSERPLEQSALKLGQSVYLVDRLSVTYRDGEVADARSLCSCIHCRLTEATVVGVVNRNQSRLKQLIKSCYWNN